ncbi:hypothetical protein MNBD_ALPHA04-2332 [hydrothermal vent metagenome]|uniref:Uncharacterized protein n=1 Tax=hydrothermal vent metagenome TaxID=652676 RepID=A0A3B0RZM4_9ZZZZ
MMAEKRVTRLPFVLSLSKEADRQCATAEGKRRFDRLSANGIILIGFKK